MGLFDKLKGREPAKAMGDEADDLPVMDEPATLAEAAKASREQQRDFRGRENAAPQVAENEGLPSVNRRKGGNKLITTLGFVFIIGAAMALIVAVNGKKPPKKSAESRQVQNEPVANRLPPIAIPDAPPPIQTADAGNAAVPGTANQGTGTVPALLGGQAKPIPVTGGQPAAGGYGNTYGPNKAPLTWDERKRAGTLLVAMQNSGSQSQPQPSDPTRVAAAQVSGYPQQPAVMPGPAGRGQGDEKKDTLAERLEPTVTKGVSAAMLPNRNYLITKGTSLDCVLQTALDSTVPGMTTCQLTRDVYSDNGHVLLLDRGTKLVGEYAGGLKQGQARIFVLWTRAETPNGVVVNLNSPGTDSLGRSGLDGWVDQHFAQRFGAAIMFSMMQDFFGYEAAKAQQGGGTVVYGNTQQATEQLAGKVLDSTINIPPTLIKNQGDHIQVMVARDLDFSSVYGLQVRQ